MLAILMLVENYFLDRQPVSVGRHVTCLAKEASIGLDVRRIEGGMESKRL